MATRRTATIKPSGAAAPPSAPTEASPFSLKAIVATVGVLAALTGGIWTTISQGSNIASTFDFYVMPHPWEGNWCLVNTVQKTRTKGLGDTNTFYLVIEKANAPGRYTGHGKRVRWNGGDVPLASTLDLNFATGEANTIGFVEKAYGEDEDRGQGELELDVVGATQMSGSYSTAQGFRGVSALVRASDRDCTGVPDTPVRPPAPTSPPSVAPTT